MTAVLAMTYILCIIPGHQPDCIPSCSDLVSVCLLLFGCSCFCLFACGFLLLMLGFSVVVVFFVFFLLGGGGDCSVLFLFCPVSSSFSLLFLFF